MTLPEGRTPLTWKDLEFGEPRYDSKGRRKLNGHPSTWQAEVEQLRKRVAQLESAVTIDDLTVTLVAQERRFLIETIEYAFELINCEMPNDAMEVLRKALRHVGKKQEGGE